MNEVYIWTSFSNGYTHRMNGKREQDRRDERKLGTGMGKGNFHLFMNILCGFPFFF